MTQTNESEPLIITYTNLLHKYRDANATEVKEFVDRHRQDLTFMRRVKTLNELFAIKKDLVLP